MMTLSRLSPVRGLLQASTVRGCSSADAGITARCGAVITPSFVVASPRAKLTGRPSDRACAIAQPDAGGDASRGLRTEAMIGWHFLMRYVG